MRNGLGPAEPTSRSGNSSRYWKQQPVTGTHTLPPPYDNHTLSVIIPHFPLGITCSPLVSTLLFDFHSKYFQNGRPSQSENHTKPRHCAQPPSPSALSHPIPSPNHLPRSLQLCGMSAPVASALCPAAQPFGLQLQPPAALTELCGMSAPVASALFCAQRPSPSRSALKPPPAAQPFGLQPQPPAALTAALWDVRAGRVGTVPSDPAPAARPKGPRRLPIQPTIRRLPIQPTIRPAARRASAANCRSAAPSPAAAGRRQGLSGDRAGRDCDQRRRAGMIWP